MTVGYIPSIVNNIIPGILSLKTLEYIYYTAKEFYNKKSPEEKPGIKAREIKLEEFYVER